MTYQDALKARARIAYGFNMNKFAAEGDATTYKDQGTADYVNKVNPGKARGPKEIQEPESSKALREINARNFADPSYGAFSVGTGNEAAAMTYQDNKNEQADIAAAKNLIQEIMTETPELSQIFGSVPVDADPRKVLKTVIEAQHYVEMQKGSANAAAAAEKEKADAAAAALKRRNLGYGAGAGALAGLGIGGAAYGLAGLFPSLKKRRLLRALIALGAGAAGGTAVGYGVNAGLNSGKLQGAYDSTKNYLAGVGNALKGGQA